MSKFKKYAFPIIILMSFKTTMALYSKGSNCSEKTEFTCLTGECISINNRCDDRTDCSDGSDEIDCDHYHCLKPQWFRCSNNKCVSSTFVCDLENDCGDESDEINCTYQFNKVGPSKPTNCSASEWQCTDGFCISIEWLCNGEKDCFDGSDETVGCAEQVYCDGFRCNNGQCIYSKWKCDGNIDCADKSDELGCDELNSKPKECDIKMGLVSCRNSCVPLIEVCNRRMSCPNLSNKNFLCSTNNHTCNTLRCSHDCVKTEIGAKCLCPSGYNLEHNVNCIDINECRIFDICDQKCENLPGSYRCYCDHMYSLQKDNKTCKVDNGDALMIFSSKTEIRAYRLKSQIYFPIASNLKQSIGVAFDGTYVYWTEIFAGNESIIKSLEDGSHKQPIITSGIDAPEDLAIDWITRNIYFTDAGMHHIGVCTNDGMYCTVLVTHGVHKPRCIVLHPAEGLMFWSDWGARPEIARANMDGTNDISFVANVIYWPNGLALDIPNNRLYWVDAKLMTLESIHLDGTNRRVVLEGIAKHPYALDVFENRIYWSDWITHTIESCDKFTGKNHHILIKNKKDYIYGIHIYHSALHPYVKNPCALKFCSDICLISGKSYRCACPHNKVLESDKHTCKVTSNDQLLLIGTHNSLMILKFEKFGRHNITTLPLKIEHLNISALAFSKRNNILFISDATSRSLIAMNVSNASTYNLMASYSFSYISDMDFDDYSNNLYWTDSIKATIEVLNLNTRCRKGLLNDIPGEIPVSITVIPEEGIFFVAFRTIKNIYHIDRFNVDGSDRIHLLEERFVGPLHLIYDVELHRIFWADTGTGNIQSASTEGDERRGFQYLQSSPIAIASLDTNIFWINRNSKKLHWSEKLNRYEGAVKGMILDIHDNSSIKHILSITRRETSFHPCQENNGNCSHICFSAIGLALCDCPLGMQIKNDNKTCFQPKSCKANEFFCKQSNICIPSQLRCDSHTDCSFGEDEDNCNPQNRCGENEFQCKNKDCIDKSLICNKKFDCKDKSDEDDCSNYNQVSCPPNSFVCSNGQCLDKKFLCDGKKDCEDGVDEQQCSKYTCSSQHFRCTNGLCIPKNWVCDQEFDCIDNSDEHENCSYAKCDPDKFLCDNGYCIDSTLKCNKMDDCGDFSDEEKCEYLNVAAECRPDEFKCNKNNTLMCIPISSRCDGFADCPEREDEQFCTVCQIDEYECDNKKCVPTLWLCDDVDDCGDGSDEHAHVCLFEQTTLMTPNITVSCDNRYRCNNGKCIDKSLLCNNVNDCGDASDEFGACRTSCLTGTNPCLDICIKTPNGPQCDCSEGYRLRFDGRTCADISECSFEPPVCSQRCTELSGSFKCKCYQGYTLRSDNTTCQSSGEPLSLVFAFSNTIYLLTRKNNSVTKMHARNDSKITSIDVSVQHGYIYYSIEETGTLHRIRLHENIQEYMNNVGRPQKIAVDWINQNIYYVDNNSSNRAIRICNFETQFCAKIIDLDLIPQHNNVSALTVDPVNEYLFYAACTSIQHDVIIYKSNLDGSNTEQILQSNNEHITGITYDFYKQILYYVDKINGKISKINYDGTIPTNIITNLSKPSNLMMFENHLYFFQPSNFLNACPLFKNYQACVDAILHIDLNELFVLYHSSRQPLITNICLNHNCSNLCIPKETTFKCLCNIDNNNFEEQCEFKQITTALHLDSINTSDEISNKTINVQLIIVIVLFVIVLLLGAYYYIYRKKKQMGNLNISMRFQNPVYGQLEETSHEITLQVGQHEYYNPMNLNAEFMQNEKKSNEALVS